MKSFKSVLSSRAQKEIVLAKNWYEKIAKGLGLEFIRSLEATIEQIRRIPRGFQQIPATKQKGVHQVRIRRFPYYVIYQVREKEVLILSIFHAKRDKVSW